MSPCFLSKFINYVLIFYCSYFTIFTIFLGSTKLKIVLKKITTFFINDAFQSYYDLFQILLYLALCFIIIIIILLPSLLLLSHTVGKNYGKI